MRLDATDCSAGIVHDFTPGRKRMFNFRRGAEIKGELEAAVMDGAL